MTFKKLLIFQVDSSYHKLVLGREHSLPVNAALILTFLSAFSDIHCAFVCFNPAFAPSDHSWAVRAWLRGSTHRTEAQHQRPFSVGCWASPGLHNARMAWRPQKGLKERVSLERG